MSDKFAGGIKCGSTDVTIPIILRSTTDNTEVTGKIYSDVTASYQRQGESRVAITTTSQTVTGTHTDGGFVEIDATNMPGNYRFDVPDAAFAAGADWVVISVKVAGCYIFYERYNLESVGSSEVYDRIGSPAGANIAADLATIDDYVDELESRLTAARAGYLDNLSGGAVALASVCTETRLAELDSANIPSDIDDILADTDELQSNQNNWLTATGFSTHSAADVWSVSTRSLTDKDGFALSSTGADLIDKDSTFALAIADAIWDEILTGATHNIATSAGKRLRQIAAYGITDGIAQGGSGYSITLASDESSVDQIFNRNMIVIVGGTGAGQTRTIVDYDGTTKVAVVDRDWWTQPDSTSEYQILADDTPLVVDHGIAQSGTSTTITLRDTSSSIDDTYVSAVVAIVTGTGEGQSRLITDYNGSTKVATISPAWKTTPTSSSVYIVMPYGCTCVEHVGDEALAQINAECDTALSDYDAPTRAEATSDKDEILSDLLTIKKTSSGTYDRDTDSLEAIRDRGDAAWSAGVANPNMLLSAEIDTVNDQTHFTLVTGSNEDDAYNDQTIVLYDDSNYDYPCVRKITDYDGSTKTVTIDSAPIFTLGADDSVKIFATAPGTTAPTASEIREEIDNNSTKLASIRSIASFIRAKLL